MNADFRDSQGRHFGDANSLFDAQRWANADHLYGVSAECGLKCLMLAFGMPFDTAADRPSRTEDRKHVDLIWERFDSYRSGHQLGPGYVISPNPFADWDVSQRYSAESNFDEQRVQRHKDGAILVNELLRKAVQEGLI